MSSECGIMSSERETVSSEPKSCQLLNLPSELLVKIIGNLHPDDIKAIGKACRLIHAITALKEVWLSATRRICSEHNIFEPSFELPAMNIRQLDRIASAPRRFRSLLAAGVPYRHLRPVTTRDTELLEPRGDPPVSPNDGFRTVCLVPGGRFVVAQSTEHLHIWDLGSWIHAAPKKIPSRRRQLYWARLTDLLGDLPQDMLRRTIWLNDCHPAEDPTSLIFTVRHQFYSDVEGEYERTLFVLRAKFTEAAGSGDDGASTWTVDVRVVSRLQIPPDRLKCPGPDDIVVRKVDDSIAVVAAKSEILIWKYNDASIAHLPSYTPGKQSGFARILAVYVTSDYVVCAHERVILTYRVPEFRPVDSAESWSQHVIAPCRVVQLDKGNAAWMSPRPWHLAQPKRVISRTLDHFSENEGIDRYHIVQNAVHSEPPEVRFVERGYVSAKLDFENDGMFKEVCSSLGEYNWVPRLDPVDGDGAVCTYRPYANVLVMIAYGGGRGVGSATYALRHSDLRAWSMCPASGRLCYSRSVDPYTLTCRDFLDRPGA
ncbi:hypothetical protein BD626DRAFT_519368 [Schizophyllum amplum]|uniref:F-box domain-containing protein n=1 Tax=Schizophyllum amplum TaxID=97359 RepID=A0A550BVB9_9AGAR|nr:hypothetical protein BD626DRAFT_519368 [Auriculariopsis ampla]